VQRSIADLLQVLRQPEPQHSHGPDVGSLFNLILDFAQSLSQMFACQAEIRSCLYRRAEHVC
jgi:hypothetical protein